MIQKIEKKINLLFLEIYILKNYSQQHFKKASCIQKFIKILIFVIIFIN